jgi:hypothetical protein
MFDLVWESYPHSSESWTADQIPQGLLDPDSTWNRIFQHTHTHTHTHIYIYIYKENVKFTTPTQQSHNNPSHEGGPYTLGPTLM